MLYAIHCINFSSPLCYNNMFNFVLFLIEKLKNNSLSWYLCYLYREFKLKNFTFIVCQWLVPLNGSGYVILRSRSRVCDLSLIWAYLHQIWLLMKLWRMLTTKSIDDLAGWSFVIWILECKIHDLFLLIDCFLFLIKISRIEMTIIEKHK